MNAPGLLEWAMQGLAVLAGGVATYAAIRSDIARLSAEVRAAKEQADRANSRLDSHLAHHDRM